VAQKKTCRRSTSADSNVKRCQRYHQRQWLYLPPGGCLLAHVNMYSFQLISSEWQRGSIMMRPQRICWLQCVVSCQIKWNW